MYNGVIERKIKENYNKVFEIIGSQAGLRKLTYETYLGLNENDTRRKHIDRLLEKTLRLRDDADICACIDTINKDIKREDRIDKIDSFFKLGEKLYPKKEEKKEEIVTPTPDRLFEVQDEEENKKEQEEETKKEREHEKEKDEIINTKNQSKIKKFAKGLGEMALAALNVTCLSIAGAATLAGILIHVPVTPGFLAIMLAAPVITYSYKGIKRLLKYLEKRNKKTKKRNEKINKTEVKQEQKEEEKTKTKTEDNVLDFGNDLEGPTELNFGDEIDDKPLEADAVSGPISGEERDTTEEPAREMPEVETELSNSDNEEPLTEPEYEGRTEIPSTRVTTEPTIVPEKVTEKITNPIDEKVQNTHREDVRKNSINNNYGGNKMNTNDYKEKLKDLKSRLEMAKNLHKEDWIPELETEISEVEKIINERKSKKQEITDNKEKLKDLKSRLEMAKSLHKEDWIPELEGEILELDKTINGREQVKQDFIDKKERLEYLKGQLNFYKGLGKTNWVDDTEKEIEELSKQIEEHDYDLDYPNDEVSRGK